MTISAWTIYLISAADSLRTVAWVALVATAGLGVLGGVLVGAGSLETDKELCGWGRGLLRKAAAAFFVALGATALLPSSKTVAAMYLVPAVVNNERVQGVASDGLKILELLTKQYVEDLAGKKDEAAE